MVQSWILPVQRSWRGKLTSGSNPVSCLSLSKLLAKSQLSIRSEISIQLQHYSKLLSHTASLGWSASLKLCLPHSLVSATGAALDGLEHCYSRLPGQETMVRVILPRSSFRRRTNAVWVIPHVLFPFTSSKMSPHLHREGWASRNDLMDINHNHNHIKHF